jgi:hypothetical protein
VRIVGPGSPLRRLKVASRHSIEESPPGGRARSSDHSTRRLLIPRFGSVDSVRAAGELHSDAPVLADNWAMDEFASRTSRRNEPAEDFTGWVTASLDESEWEIHCGAETCDEFIADASWIDVQMAMMMNSGDEWSAEQANRELPPIYRRQFRMNVQFMPGWDKDDRDVWKKGFEPQVDLSGLRRHSENYTQRYIRGILRQAKLNLEAQPPSKVICPACETLQLIPRRYRKGVPALIREAAS